jgi:diguanylate cyclase (GGDEF)-like protein
VAEPGSIRGEGGRVTQDRLERDRKLVARTVALLSAELPLGVMMQRLRDLIAEAFDATAFVMLAEDRATAAPAHAAALESVFRTGEPVRTAAELFVPIAGDAKTLGVIGLARDREPALTQDDQRLLEAVARYVGIAVRNRRPFRVGALASRHPWVSIVLACVVALGISTALGFYARARVLEMRSTARTLQDGRLRQTALILEDYLGDSVHLSDAVANVIGPIRGDEALAETLLIHFFKSVGDPAIFGMGIYFEPYQFDARHRLYDPYIDRKISRKSGGGYDFFPTQPKYEYDRYFWYALGRKTGHIAFTRPYFEDYLTYLSTIRPFYRGNAFAGVVSVDALPKKVVALLRSRLEPGDVAWVTDGASGVVLSTGTIPSSPSGYANVATPLRWAPWTLHLSSDSSAVDAAVRQTISSAALVGVATWVFAFLIMLFSIRANRERFQALDLALRHADLENEIAAHLDVEERLRESAYRDSLTGLSNRPFFLEALADRLEERRAEPGAAFAVLFVDIDRFSVINDSLGHGAGDVLLRLIAARIVTALPPAAELARLGGDEFVALVDLGDGGASKAVAFGQDVLAKLRDPFTIFESEFYSGASIGIVVSDERYSVPEELLRDADIAMYQAKKTGRGRCVVFDSVMHDRARALLLMESDLRRAVSRGEVRPYYQPIVDVRECRMVSMEALARWERADGSVANAAEFIDVAEQTGALATIDAAVMQAACRDAQALQREFGRPIEVSVNVSATQLTRTDIVSDIRAALAQSGLAPESLKLEITESAIMENAEEALLVLDRLRGLGLDVVVDDFGTGYSSLSYLRRLPISGLKIDRSFVMPVTTDAQAAAIVRAIVALAKTLGLDVTAEGVETAEQLDLLRECGVDFAQGYYFARALPLDVLRGKLAPGSEAF